MEGEYSFCPECGTPVALDAQDPSPDPLSAGETPADKPVKPAFALSMKAKILIASGLVFVLLIVGAYFLGKYMSDEQRLLDRFEQAIDEGKPDKLLELLSASNEDIHLDQKTASGMVNYLNSNKQSFATLMEQLKSEAEQIKSGEEQAMDAGSDVAFIYLTKKDKKRWLLYNDYELKVKRYMIPVRTNYEGAKILVDGKETATASGEDSAIEVGPFLPGVYEIKSVYEGEYTTLQSKQLVYLFPLNGRENSVELMLEGDYVQVYSNNSLARIYINGQDINLTVDEGQRIGPIAVDGSNKMFVEVEYPWGKMRSEELPVDNDQLEFTVNGLDDSAKEEIMIATHDFISSWMQSFKERANVLRHASPNRSGDIDEYLADMKKNNESYIGNLHRVTFDLDSFRLNRYSEEEYRVNVKLQLDYNEVFYFSEYETDPVPVEGTNNTEYLLEYANGQWLVSGWNAAYDVGTVNTKVFE